MYVLGVTGGIGSGKSVIREFLSELDNVVTIDMDSLSKTFLNKGEDTYYKIIELFGKEIVGQDGELIKPLISSKIFNDDNLRLSLNNILHPAVLERVNKIIDEERVKEVTDIVVCETAIPKEAHLEEYTDKIIYVYCNIEERIRRLTDIRGYSISKAQGIISSQPSEEEYKNYADAIIDNSGDIEKSRKELFLLLNEWGME